MQMLDAMDVENKMLGKSKGTYLVIGNLGTSWLWDCETYDIATS